MENLLKTSSSNLNIDDADIQKKAKIKDWGKVFASPPYDITLAAWDLDKQQSINLKEEDNIC